MCVCVEGVCVCVLFFLIMSNVFATHVFLVRNSPNTFRMICLVKEEMLFFEAKTVLMFVVTYARKITDYTI